MRPQYENVPLSPGRKNWRQKPPESNLKGNMIKPNSLPTKKITVPARGELQLKLGEECGGERSN